MKVERVSYDVMTPSAARGILEAIYWKPQMRWLIERIHVLKPIRFTNIRRNEVSEKAVRPSAALLAGGSGVAPGLMIEEKRQQRAATLLRDVAYVIEAAVEVIDRHLERDGPEMEERACGGKHLDMFNRRARAGQCFHQPYFGCREFPAAFRLLAQEEALPASELPEDQRNRHVGWMLHDIAFVPADNKAGDSFLTGQGKRVRAEPRFFEAQLRDGVLHVPPFTYAKA
jgi:CRISPR-associated protein Cas5d